MPYSALLPVVKRTIFMTNPKFISLYYLVSTVGKGGVSQKTFPSPKKGLEVRFAENLFDLDIKKVVGIDRL